MKFELTAVYEPQPDGWIVASIAEIPGVHTQGRTMEEARENLSEALLLIIESNRDLTLAEAQPEATFERFPFESISVP